MVTQGLPQSHRTLHQGCQPTHSIKAANPPTLPDKPGTHTLFFDKDDNPTTPKKSVKVVKLVVDKTGATVSRVVGYKPGYMPKGMARTTGKKARWRTVRGKPVMIKGPRKPTGKSLSSSSYLTGDRARGSILSGYVVPAKGPTLSMEEQDQIMEGWEGDRRGIAGGALYAYNTGSGDVVLAKDGNETVGVCGISKKRWDGLSLGPAYSYEPEIDEKGTFREVYDVATKRKGYGNQTMVELAREVHKDGSGLFLKSIPDAVGFYKAIGMREGVDRFGAHVFYWTPKDLQFVLSEGEKAKSIEDLEPEDGIFVASRKRREGKKGVILTDTKKGRWVTIRGRRIFIAKGRGKAGAGGGAAMNFDKDRWGAMDVGDRRDKWEALNESQRDDITDAADSIPQHQTSLTSHAGARPDLEGDDVSGAIDSRINALTVKDGQPYIPSEDAALIGSTVHDFDSVLSEAGVSPELRHKLTMEAADALVAQDRESIGRTLGDHGIHHIRGNVDNTMGILGAHPDADPAEARAAAYVANIFHDTGYMAPPSQMFLDMGHPRWSQQHYDENLRPLVKDAFGARMAGNVSHLIRTHASTNIDWSDDVLGSAVRVADNVALFQKQKLPALFRNVPGNTGVLEQLGAGKINAKRAQQLLRSNLDKANLSPSIKTQMAKGIPEVFSLTPKFTLGMLGGDILGFSWDKGALTVRLGRNAEADRLQKMLDLGQRQFAKFAKTYGVDPQQFTESLQFELKGPGGQTVMRSTIEEMKALLKMMEGWKAKGRWRTLRDGRHVNITGSIPRAYTVTRAGVRENVTKGAEAALESIAARQGLDTDDVKEIISDTIDREIYGKPVAINVPYQVLPEIVDDGRFQNQHESGVSSAFLDPKFRAYAESNVFNVGTDDPPENYPIYGYVHGAGASLTSMYGQVRFEFKDSVKSRTTMTVDDSLGYMEGGGIAPAPLSRAHKEPGCWDGVSTMSYLARGNASVVTYFETQIHGGVTLKDVSRIVMPSFHNLPVGVQAQMGYIEEVVGRQGIEVVYGEG
jgi:hypothetical protein